MFAYQDQQLTCEQIPLADIAAAHGTPTYVYSQAILAERASAYLTGGSGTLPCYALKANANSQLLKLLASWKLGADVTSGGELFLALQAGFPPDKIIFSGVGKQDHEIVAALEAGIRALHVESPQELAVIEELAAGLGLVAPIGVRLNPDIDPQTHPYISTGLLAHKFGVPVPVGLGLLEQAERSSALQPVGIATHLGSQIEKIAPYREAVDLLLAVVSEVRGRGIPLKYVDVGGGVGIDYAERGQEIDISQWVELVSTPLRAAGLEVVMEPGRSIVGPAGLLLTRVVYEKWQAEKRFVIVDAGMNDLLRPTLYQAEHPIWPVREVSGGVLGPADVVGPICESGDFLARERPLPKLVRGDLVAIMQAGAYGFAMGSNYNGRCRPAEVLVHAGATQLIRPRQTYADLL